MELDKYTEMNEFIAGLQAMDIELTDLQKLQFMDYYELLIEWNKVMNLTAITELKEVIHKHFIDSLSLVKVYRPKEERILDIGTGAGFPGIPLKIAFPDIDIVLLDSLNKRLIFLDEVIMKLGLKKVRTLHARAEEYGKDSNYREQFDLVVSRAVAKLSTLSEYSLPYVKIGGQFISYKSGNMEEELQLSQRAIKILGSEISSITEFQLPGTDIQRTLIALKKKDKTPLKYPRSGGKPSKEPL